MNLGVRLTTKFKKDADKMKRQGKNLDKMYDVIEILAMHESLPSKYRDHALTGNYVDCRECHIEADWLLIYKVEEEELILVLTRTGSHSDLF
ncbi:MAG: type II toxin-antitoxin system YafQ family toxin [Clostridiales bacterium]|jgi:mRNA interferase YafQ|nr:type II toxin-antitoxin system YafQ family toxin [Clostridiales bacterium]